MTRWGIRVIRRKLDCLKPSLQEVQHLTHRKASDTGANPCDRIGGCLSQSSGAGAMPSEGIQGDERAA